MSTSVSGTFSTATVTNLLNGTSYAFTVYATDSWSSGPSSTPSNAVTPAGTTTTPTAPQSATATPGANQALVSWSPPASPGGAAITYSTRPSPPLALTPPTPHPPHTLVPPTHP